MDRQLEQFRDINAFAEPLLKAEIKARFDLELDVKKTLLRLYVPATTPLFGIKTGARAWTVSLLEAALHNFEEKETKDDAYNAASTYIVQSIPPGQSDARRAITVQPDTQPSPPVQFETLPWLKQKLSIPAFTKMCRELDIGAQYQSYLEDHLGISNAEKGAALRKNVDKSQKAALKAALQFARLNGDISGGYFRTIQALIDGVQHLRVKRQHLQSQELTMMGAPLTGILVFAPQADEARTLARVVAYVPDDPEHPIKEYASSAELEKELTRQLRSKDYQKFFSRFVNHEHRGFFFSSLNSRLSEVTWHTPVAGSPDPVWRDEPFEQPDLQVAATVIPGDLWQHQYQKKLNKILNDGKVIAVPTATVDSKARWALWDSFVGIASAILQTAAFIIAPFVPGLGELMMAYMGYQFLDEVFEGIVDWAQGQLTEAFKHLVGLMDSAIQLGLFAVGGSIAVGEFRKVLPKEVIAFIERFKPVKLANGKTRYWDQDLTRYQQKSLPPADSKPSPSGLHDHQGKQILPLEDAHFAVSESATPGRYRIEHPTRPEAYQPVVRHNGDGAWHTELEQPLEWDKATALRRIGHEMQAFTPERRERILQVSGCSEDALRKMHADQETLPPLLADTITRFKIDQDLQVFIDQMASDQPEQYRRADAQTQLQLLTEHGRWPAGKRLRLLDGQGEVIWQSSSDEALPVTDLRQNSLIDNDVLTPLLQVMSEEEAKALLGEPFGGPNLPLDIRTGELRKQLLQLANAQRGDLFESRYRTSENVDDPLHTTLAQFEPPLPSRVTEELLNTTRSDELLQISEGQLPERQQALMQVASEEVRVTRAFEGLELDSVNNPDTDTLILHSLRNLPGWSGEVRLEIREGSFEGNVIDSTGRVDAPERKVLVRKHEGTYQPFDDRGQELHVATDIYSSILHALPDTERQAMDIHIGQTEKLKAAIRARPFDRSDFRVAIAPQSIRQPAVDTLRLRGQESYEGPSPVVDVATPPHLRGDRLQDGIRLIYRGYNEEDARAFAARFGENPRDIANELTRLRNEFTQLRDSLREWETRIPANDPQSAIPLTETQRRAAQQSRRAFTEAIERCWRRETREPAGYLLQIEDPIMGDLPILSGDFSHVRSLILKGSASTRGLEPFLRQFPGVLSLNVRNLHLPNLPPALTSMPSLQRLVMNDCGISLSPANRATLASLPRISVLDLSNNPLGEPLDVHSMPTLGYLNLDNTGISTVPAGMLEHPRLVTGRFAGNQITEIPDEFFSLATTLSDGYRFGNNPLSAASREQVKLYYRLTRKYFGVLPDQAEIQLTRRLFPAVDANRAVELIYQLPGTLVEGRARLQAWEAELGRLRNGLANWCNQVPHRSPATQEPLTVGERNSERLARLEFSQKLVNFWRDRSPFPPHIRNSQLELTLDFVGDMPVLDTDFNHVGRLTLHGNKGVTGVLPFLRGFEQLTSLELSYFDFDPASLTAIDLPELETLQLKHCGVVMTPENQAKLVSMPQLKMLDLSDNPLGTFPDVTQLPELTHIDLSNTGLTQVPAGLADHANLSIRVLSGNRFTELPEALFELPADRTDGIDFANNPLSLATREQIKIHYRKTGQDFDVLAAPLDVALAQTLFPSLDKFEASQIIYDLPGTLAEARIRLRTWQVELATLQADLTAWVIQVPTQHPVTGEAISVAEQHINRTTRRDFAQRVEEFWRSRSSTSGMREDAFEANLTFQGDMPTLTADFSHVARLVLRGNPAISATGQFLERFPTLQILQLHDFSLGEIPASLTRLPELKEVTMANCNLTLTNNGQSVLESLSELELLDLSSNPLTLTPDITNMPSLNDLRLSGSGITAVPDGIGTHPSLRHAQLDNNTITELPEAFFDLDLYLADATNLSANPLSLAARERIKVYYTQRGRNFGILPDPTDISRTQQLFPALNVEDAAHVVYRLPGTLADGTAQLANWEAEIGTMLSDLETWVQRIPVRTPDGQIIDITDRATQSLDRQAFSRKVEQFWRKRFHPKSQPSSSSFIAELTFFGELPALTADFNHVVQLSLTGHKGLTSAEGFLRCFTGLKALEVRDFALGRFPEAVATMPGLKALVLSRCDIVFDEPAQTRLSSLSNLRSLDLYDNPLGRVPDLSQLPELSVIDLASTAIDQFPIGLAERPRLTMAMLSENNIIELPEALFRVAARISDGFDLSGNPLSEAARDRIKVYRRNTGSDFSVPVEYEDIELAQTLYPRLDGARLNDIVYSLPGTLAEGRLELVRRQSEIATMSHDLESWVNTVPVDPVTQLPLAGDALQLETANRTAFKASLEDCWRRVTHDDSSEFKFSSSIPITGELPVVSADFGHISRVNLSCETDIAPRIGQFLNRFRNVKKLYIQGYQLGTIPEVILEMEHLAELSLQECGIALTEETVQALSRMNTLIRLSLKNNRLTVTPDLSQMTALVWLDLSGTGLNAVPAGLLDRPYLEYADLSNNAIIELPANFSSAKMTSFNFSGNPLSEESLQYVEAQRLANANALAEKQRLQQEIIDFSGSDVSSDNGHSSTSNGLSESSA
ncbi:dermonecrotic toxin domain-containing protein [Pseudomonas sp. IT-347P]|uniref:dermonecrotic toxin domain-containing protein n=1 Tax=Pseudomonas sp. IT-347P TaxID=3026458 RepID=UPI0039E0A63D